MAVLACQGDPDAIVFGDWQPPDAKPGWEPHRCRGCGCQRAGMGPCWQCGAMVSP